MKQIISILCALATVVSLPSVVFGAEVYTQSAIASRYQTDRITILIVPGHTKEAGGTQFGSVIEREINVRLAHALKKRFAADSRIEVLVSRDETGDFAPWFQAYLANHGEAIDTFRREAAAAYNRELAAGTIEKKVLVEHNDVTPKALRELYGANKYAVDFGVDIVLHVHFNDYVRPVASQPGKHSGFAIYTPESVLPNSEVGFALARPLANHLGVILPKSSLPGESTGIVPEQELIAVGSYRTLTQPSLLIEYSYIYEPQLQQSATREVFLETLADRTAAGVYEFLGVTKESDRLPYEWSRDLVRGTTGADVYLLQYALRKAGHYPPVGTSLSECPLTGRFGPCTERSVRSFARTHGYDTARVGPKTRALLGTID